tara:strand:- start:2776 stop:3801 length:1026 start_codon:yes stop_codon:yes gene_type:complete
MTVSAFISGCEGLILTASERQFLSDANPWGFILFGRNIESPDQVARLVASFRDCVGRHDAPVLIDQEGGRVQRLKPPLWSAYPPGAMFGRLEQADPEKGCRAAMLGGLLIGTDLLRLGINVDCLPVLDVPVSDTTKAIGDRAYADNPEVVSRLGAAAAQGLISAGVLPVIKHLPGHGRAVVDSHLELPRVAADLAALSGHDFAAFRPLAGFPLGMTAHVVYEAVDPDNPATLSAAVIETVIRQQIGFQGLLMSDDISMGALQSAMPQRVASAISAGCDVVLHCNGLMDEMQDVAANVPALDGLALARANAALAARKTPVTLDEAAVRAELASLLATVGWEA